MATGNQSTCASTPNSPLRPGFRSSLRLLLASANLSPSSPRYGKIGSPLSCLAVNLSVLSTDECCDETPKRKLSLSSIDTPSDDDDEPPSHHNDGSPSFLSSPTVEISLSKLAQEYNKDRPSSYGRSRSLPFRKLDDLPIPEFSLNNVDLESSDDDCDDNESAVPDKHEIEHEHKDFQLQFDLRNQTIKEMIDTSRIPVTVATSTAFSMEACLTEHSSVLGDNQQHSDIRDESALTTFDSTMNSCDWFTFDSQESEDGTNPRLDDSDSQGIVADINDSTFAYKISPETVNASAKMFYLPSDTSDLEGSYIASNTPVKSQFGGKFSKSPSHSGTEESLIQRCEGNANGNTLFSETTGLFSYVGSIDDNSQDSGVSMDRDKTSPFRFPTPVSAVPRRVRLISEETCSPLKYSPIKSSRHPSISPPSFNSSFSTKPALSEASPVSLKTSPLTGTAPSSDLSPENDVDDGFISEIDAEIEHITNKGQLPDSFSSLFTAPLLNSEAEDATIFRPKTKVCRKLLDRSKSVQDFSVRSKKRLSPMVEEDATPQCKRRRSSIATDSTFKPLPAPKSALKRCNSESVIKSMLNKVTEDTNLIGDGSKAYLLPLTRGRHDDLKCISSHTMADLVTNQIRGIERCIIIDCRYPYEFLGGHIRGAINLYQKQDIIDEFLHQPIQASDPAKRVLLVFHCEFSAERAPNLSRFLRNRDRDTNQDNYPDLYYPEMYLLDGGYKAFYEQHPSLCDPSDYKPMLHEDHREDLRRLRVKSRSWCDGKMRSSVRLKF